MDAHDRVVEAGIHENASKSLPGDLDNDVGNDESLPRIGLARSFSNFVQVTLGDEVRLDLYMSQYTARLSVMGGFTCWTIVEKTVMIMKTEKMTFCMPANVLSGL